MAFICAFFFVLEILLSMTTSAATEIPIWWGGGMGVRDKSKTTIALEIPLKVDHILSEKYPVYKYFTTRGKLEHLKLFLL